MHPLHSTLRREMLKRKRYILHGPNPQQEAELDTAHTQTCLHTTAPIPAW